MTRISSSLSVIYKRVLPALIGVGLAGLVTVASIEWADGNLAQAEALGLMLGAAAFAIIFCSLYYLLIWDLADAVYDTGDTLLVVRRGNRTQVPFAEMASVRYRGWLNPPRITIEMKPATHAAPICFTPHLRLLPLLPHPVTGRLREKIATYGGARWHA